MAQKGDAQERTSSETLSDNHANHAEHLCSLMANRKIATVARLAQNAQFICHICGRVAAEAKHLCDARPIKS